MKTRLALICSFTMACSIARADDGKALDLRQAQLEKKTDAGCHLRDAGIVTTVIGAIMAGAGIALTVKTSRSGNVDDGALQGPGALLAVGMAGMAGGVPMWIIGQRRVTNAEAVKISASLGGVRVTF